MGHNASRAGGDAQRVVEDAISAHPVVVFSKSYCPYCTKGKNALAAAAASVPSYPGAKVFELDRMGAEGAAIQAYLTRKTGRRTVPNVFIKGASVGGGDETAALHRRAALAPLIQDAVANKQKS